MSNPSTNITARLGGESQRDHCLEMFLMQYKMHNPNDRTRCYNTDTKPNMVEYNPNIIAKYDYIIGLFEASGMNKQVSKAYALLCIDSVKTLGISFDKLFESMTDPISFSNLGLTLINPFVPIHLSQKLEKQLLYHKHQTTLKE